LVEYDPPKDPVLNPLVEFQLGTAPDGSPCVIFTYLGESGKKVTVIHEDFEYYRAIITLMEHGKDVWAMAVAQGIDKALETYGHGDEPAPDDISSLLDEGGGPQ
jgi:hypothetical protein